MNSWTVHGLWPDHCDGTYDANCDTTRAYTNITAILKAAGQTSLLTYMGTYWKDYQGNDEDFWEHEWAKHGTCISTLKPSCYTSYVQQEEVVDYFETTVNLFKSLDSYAVSPTIILPYFCNGPADLQRRRCRRQASFHLPQQPTLLLLSKQH